METHVHFTNSTHVATLSAAVLLYTERERNSVYDGDRQDFTAATVHPVKEGEIQPGRPITRADVEQLAAGLGRKHAGVQFIPEHVVALSAQLMAWWMPARLDRIWFHPSDRHKDDAATLQKISGEKVYHPPLFWVVRAERDVNIYALAKNERPTPSTVLYKAPYWNIGNNGDLCVGGARMPRELLAENIPKFEQAFFASNFAHCNYHGTFTQFPGGHNALWKAMLVPPTCLRSKHWYAEDGKFVAKRHAKYLVKSPVTMKEAIK